MFWVATAAAAAVILYCGCSEEGIGWAFYNMNGANSGSGSGSGSGSVSNDSVNNTGSGGNYNISQSCGDRACKTVKIDGLTWMAENLNYKMLSASWCYENNDENCAIYGRLYTWDAALAACPSGWHLPSREEWGELARIAGDFGTYGGNGAAGHALKSTNGWEDNVHCGITCGNGSDDFGFTALPGGMRESGGRFNMKNDIGFWWTSADGYGREIMTYDARMFETKQRTDNGLSVRCILNYTAYAVTVSSEGTTPYGAGFYAAGRTVAISAGKAPANQQFKNWTTSSRGVIFADANNKKTTFKMPSNAVTVTAVFEVQAQTWDGSSPGTFTDSRDGTTYKKVKIGEQIWMAENLNYQTASGSWCYNDDISNCKTYGRLYDWITAMGGIWIDGSVTAEIQGSCPNGWHLPSAAEWDVLVATAGGWSSAGKKLKSTSGWSSGTVSHNGTDDYGFSALSGGNCYSDDETEFWCGGIGSFGYWWMSSGESVRSRKMDYSSDNVSSGSFYSDSDNLAYSVRCVED